jgi:hypothetical protein
VAANTRPARQGNRRAPARKAKDARPHARTRTAATTDASRVFGTITNPELAAKCGDARVAMLLPLIAGEFRAAAAAGDTAAAEIAEVLDGLFFAYGERPEDLSAPGEWAHRWLMRHAPGMGAVRTRPELVRQLLDVADRAIKGLLGTKGAPPETTFVAFKTDNSATTDDCDCFAPDVTRPEVLFAAIAASNLCMPQSAKLVLEHIDALRVGSDRNAEAWVKCALMACCGWSESAARNAVANALSSEGRGREVPAGPRLYGGQRIAAVFVRKSVGLPAVQLVASPE